MQQLLQRKEWENRERNKMVSNGTLDAFESTVLISARPRCRWLHNSQNRFSASVIMEFERLDCGMAGDLRPIHTRLWEVMSAAGQWTEVKRLGVSIVFSARIGPRHPGKCQHFSFDKDIGKLERPAPVQLETHIGTI